MAGFFVAESDGRTPGRIAVMENRCHNAHRQVRSAFFGSFDAVEDGKMARAPFSAAVAYPDVFIGLHKAQDRVWPFG
jgi:hypothetical protein